MPLVHAHQGIITGGDIVVARKLDQITKKVEREMVKKYTYRNKFSKPAHIFMLQWVEPRGIG